MVWKNDDEYRAFNFLLVHKNLHPNQSRKCDPGSGGGYAGSTHDLRDFLGSNGLARLLGFLAVGPMKDSHGSSRALTIHNLDQFVDLVHRFHTPHYEQARLNFNDPDLRVQFADSNEYAPYVQVSLEDAARDHPPY